MQHEFLPHDPADDAHRIAPAFDIVIDLEKRFLHITVRGEWDDESAEAYARDLHEAAALLAVRGGTDFILTNALDYGQLTLDLNTRLSALIRELFPQPSWRNAIVTRSILNKAQVRAESEIDNVRFFRSVDDALAWLFSDEA